MIVTKENERLFCKTWTYNAARILSELAQVVENNGGRVKYGHAAIISNYRAEEARREYTEKIQRLEDLEKNESKPARAAALEKYRRKLDAIGPELEPVRVTHTTYISFVLDGFYYYFQVDDNPFFEFLYQKTPVRADGTRSLDAYLVESKKEWLYDTFIIDYHAAQADCREAACMILNELQQAAPSGIARDAERRRVPNSYNSGYHYETVYKPERRAALDF